MGFITTFTRLAKDHVSLIPVPLLLWPTICSNIIKNPTRVKTPSLDSSDLLLIIGPVPALIGILLILQEVELIPGH